jgi:riboflavin kinase/FMN adenylyltransferase
VKFIRGLYNINARDRGCVAAIGNFDGVHLGHQQILQQLADYGKRLQLPSVVIVFEPQPQEYFSKEDCAPRLTRLREKLLAFRQYGAERVLCLQFNQALAELSAEKFIQKILIDGLGIRHLVVGSDFRFGHQRGGDVALLQQAGKQHNFEVTSPGTLEIDGLRVSSTRIRTALSSGDLLMAKRLLGRDYGMCGRVVHGDKQGRNIGFPTANLYLHRKVSPVLGVYAVRVHGIANDAILGVANVGNRPTRGGHRSLLEVH